MDIGMQAPTHPVQRVVARVLQGLRGGQPPLNPKPTYGIELTNELARKHGLNVEVVLAASPEDVDWVVEKHLGGPPSFVFIDGGHSVHQVLLDFDACFKVAAVDCVFLLHDVINWGLREGFEQCQKKSGLAGLILWRTPSGMGLLYPKARVELERVLRSFGEDEGEMQSTESETKALEASRLAGAEQVPAARSPERLGTDCSGRAAKY